MTIKVATVALVAVFATGSYAVESNKIQVTAATTLRTSTTLGSAIEQPVRTKMLAVNSVASEGRSSSVTTAVEESNTTAMLLAGLAIMGLVVRRRMG